MHILQLSPLLSELFSPNDCPKNFLCNKYCSKISKEATAGVCYKRKIDKTHIVDILYLTNLGKAGTIMYSNIRTTPPPISDFLQRYNTCFYDIDP